MANKKIIFVFPGQGAQYPCMGIDLFDDVDSNAASSARSIFDTASDVLGQDIVALVRDSDADTLKRTDVSQVAITAASLAANAYLNAKGIQPMATAGFSLGEYPALACAKVISIEDCFRLVSERGKAMQEALANIQSSGADAPGMAAVLGLEPEQVEDLIAAWKQSGSVSDLYAANINSSKQVVVSGSASALSAAESLFKEAGAKRVMRLAVAGPFHSPLMNEAAVQFSAALEKTTFNDPAIMLFSNVTGEQVRSGSEAKELAVRHITESVRWTKEQAAFCALQPDVLLEVGPGKVLQGLWKDTASAAVCYAAGTAADIHALENV